MSLRTVQLTAEWSSHLSNQPLAQPWTMSAADIKAELLPCICREVLTQLKRLGRKPQLTAS